MANLLYRLSTKTINDRAEVLIRFYDGRFEQSAHSRIYVPVNKWNAKNRKLQFSTRFYTPEVRELAEMQQRLDELRTYIFDAWISSAYPDKSWLQTTIDSFIHPDAASSSGLTLSDACRAYPIAHMIADATARQFASIGNIVAEFEQNHPLLVGSITQDDLSALFQFFLISRSGNTAITKMRKLRSVLRWCRSSGKADNCPFDGWPMPEEVYGIPYALTKEERDQVYAFANLPDSLLVSRDAFILQCHVGCRVSDLLKLTPGHLRNGGRFIEYSAIKQRNKDPKTVRIPLSAVAREIIARYDGIDRHGRLMPFPDTHDYNERIRFILRLAGITRQVLVINPKTRLEEHKPICDIASSHLARRTFINIIFQATKSEAVTVSMTDHSEGSKALARYRTVDDQMKMDVLSSILGEDLSEISD